MLSREAEQSPLMDILSRKKEDDSSDWSHKEGTNFEIWGHLLRKDIDKMKQNPENISD